MHFHPLAAAAAVMLSTTAAHAAPVQQLRCIDDQLSDAQRVGIAEMFAPQTADPAEVRMAPHGSATAAHDLVVTLGSCAQQFAWSQPTQKLATQYLIHLGALSKLRVDHPRAWSGALDLYYPSAAKRLTAKADLSDYAITLIAAGARANGLPRTTPAIANTPEADQAIVDYLYALKALESARTAFAN